ncbi:MAG: transposase [Bacillus sp. (in: Bacteria)]|nr:transposase [Bacillus sp. (in: firmicutes)]
MGRNVRLWIPTSYYHITCRGNRRDALFLDRKDYITFFYILRKLHEKYPIELAAYCLMTNHYHLLLRSNQNAMSKIMGLLNKRYATYFNIKYRLTGHLFEKRFYDKHIGTEYGMLEVSKYIHMNPLEASIVSQLEDYRWSSFCSYMGLGAMSDQHQLEVQPYFNYRLLDYFQGTLEEKRMQLREWCLSPPENCRKV